MSSSGITPNQSWDARAKRSVRVRESATNAQDGDDFLAVVPAHLTNELDACDQVNGAAGPEEQPVALNQEARHAHRFGIRYPNRK